MAGKKNSKPLRFEEGLTRLEEIAQQMERGELALDELLKLYEEGVALTCELTQKLDAAEGRMQEVRANQSGEPQAIPTDLTEQGNLLDEL